MIDVDILTDALVDIFSKPIKRGEREFGASGIPFCMKKEIYKRQTSHEVTTNGKMMIGKAFHDFILPELVERTPYAEVDSPRWNFPKYKKMKPQYEFPAKFYDKRDFDINGHIDCWLPSFSKVIELKTTSSNYTWDDSQFIPQAYIQQANAYACCVGAQTFEIWQLHLDVEDISKAWEVAEYDADQKIFEEFLDRVYYIQNSLDTNSKVAGPEEEWECKYCDFFRICDDWKEYHNYMIIKIRRGDSMKKADLTDEQYRWLRYAKEHKYLKYNRSSKEYDILDKYDEESEEFNV